MSEKGKRNASADILKTIAIYGVVFIHGAKLLAPDEYVETLMTQLFRFCVPVFIILWAYFFERSLLTGKGIYKYSESRFISLFIPYLFWTIVYFFIVVDFNKFSYSDLITGYWSGYGWAGQYFFIILFQLILLFPLFRWLIFQKRWVVYALITISFALYLLSGYHLWTYDIVLKIGDRFFIYWIPYVIIGILAARYEIFTTIHIRVGGALLLVLMIPLEFYILNVLRISHSAYVTPMVLIASLALTFSVMYNSYKYEDLPVFFSKFIKIVSANTLGIFCVNPLMIWLLEKVIQKTFLLQFNSVFSTVFLSLLSGLLVLVVSLSFVLLLKRIGLREIV